MELLEVVLVEVVEEASASDRVRRDVQIVDVRVPIVTHPVNGGHRLNIS